MQFLQELTEARLTRQESNLRTLTYTDCSERTYLILLTLEVMRNFAGSRGFVSAYARRTMYNDNFKIFRSTSTDLYNFIYFLVGDEKAINKLKDPGSAMKMRENTVFPINNVKLYLNKLKANTVPNEISDMFLRLERTLGINNSDYKEVRRNAVNFNKLDTKKKQDTVTRLLFALRAKLRSSDIIDDFEKLAAIKDLETGRVVDNEPTVSKPDIEVTSKDLALYRYLVGTENLMKTKRFVDLARNGQSIPSVIADGYLPIIKMIDDIVKGGPQYVQLLRTIHKKSKK